MFSFLNRHKPPFSESQMLSANFFVRIACFMIRKRGVEFSHFILKNMDLIQSLVNSLDVECFAQLLLVMLESEVQVSHVVKELKWSEKLVGFIGERFAQHPSMRSHIEGIADVIETLVTKHSAESPVVAQLQTEYTFVRPLAKNAFDDNPIIAESHLAILLSVLLTCRNDKEYETTKLPGIIEELLQLSEVSDKPFKKLFKLLYTPPSNLPCTVQTASSILSPLGLYRLKLVQLVNVLVSLNYHFIDNQLIEHRVIARVIDLFFQYKWNNILHCTVQNMVINILTNKPSFLSLHILRDCHLLERILQAQQNEEQEKSIKKVYDSKEARIPHQGK